MTCVYISAHLDDAVLSCAAALVSRRAAGQRVIVATVFSEGSPARAEQDRRALASIGIEAVHLGLADAPIRLGLAPSFHTLVLRPPSEPTLPEQVAQRVASLLRAIGPCEQWWPLAIGGHVDHLAVFEASRRVAPSRARYYEDRPYAFAPALYTWRRHQLGERVGAPMPAASTIRTQLANAGCAAMLTTGASASEQAECLQRLTQCTRDVSRGPALSLRSVVHTFAGHGAAALALIARYREQVDWLLGGAPLPGPWSRAGFGGAAPTETEIALEHRGDARQ